MTRYVLLHGYYDGSSFDVLPIIFGEESKELIEAVLQAVEPDKKVRIVEVTTESLAKSFTPPDMFPVKPSPAGGRMVGDSLPTREP